MRAWGFILMVVALAGCDAVEPQRPTLVVEAVLESGSTASSVQLRSTVPLTSTDQGALDGANVQLTLDGETTRYVASAAAGTYAPERPVTVTPGAAWQMDIDSPLGPAVGAGTVPPPISIQDLVVTVPDEPTPAVLLDSLSVPLDSLAFEIPSREGFLYLIQVELTWDAAPGGHYIEARLDPVADFSSTLIEFFLLTRAVISEPSTPGRVSWSGVYAIPVPEQTTPLPPHVLRVGLVRGDETYARFALSDDDPDQREPTATASGAVGLMTAIAIDRRTVSVP